MNSHAILGKEIAAPFVPNLEEHNFDASELGDDEEEFTALVHEDIARATLKKHHQYKEYYTSPLLTDHANPILPLPPLASLQEAKENSTPQEPLSKLKRNISKERLKEIVRSHNILQRV